MKPSSIVWFLLFTALIFRLTTIYFEIFQNAEPPITDVEKWMAGKLPRPYSTRPLMTWIIVVASQGSPEAVRHSVETGALRLPIRALSARMESQVLGVLVILCYAGYTLVMRKFILSVFGPSNLKANLITACSLYLMPVMFQYHNYVYDPSTILLSTLLWYLMYRERWTVFLLVFILACINKETALLFILSVVLWRTRNEEFRKILPYTALLLAAGLLVRIGISLQTAHLPGSFIELHLLDHNKGHIFPNPDVQDLVSNLFIGFLIFSFWKEKPVILAIGIFHLTIMVASALFAGYIDEYRLYFDCFPMLVLTIAYSLIKLGGGSLNQSPALGVTPIAA